MLVIKWSIVKFTRGTSRTGPAREFRSYKVAYRYWIKHDNKELTARSWWLALIEPQLDYHPHLPDSQGVAPCDNFKCRVL